MINTKYVVNYSMLQFKKMVLYLKPKTETTDHSSHLAECKYCSL